mgnify:FL=1
MKKSIVALLSLVMAISLCSCGNSSQVAAPDADVVDEIETTEEPAKTELRLALRSGAYADVIKECLPEFEQKYNVSCKIQSFSEDELYSAISEDAQNSEGLYDLCMVDGSWMAEFTDNQVLANLSDLGYRLDTDIIVGTTDICYVGNDLYLAPYYGNVTVLLFNKDNVKAAGYDTNIEYTLDDVYNICKTAEKSGKLGFIFRGDSKNNLVVDFLPILLAHGGWVVDENNNPTIDTPEFKEAMQYYLKLLATGQAMTKDDMIAAIDSGEAAMGIGWPGWYMPDEDTPAAYCALDGGYLEDGTQRTASVYGVWTIGIPQNCTNKDLAKELVAYLMDKDVQKSTIAGGGVPCRYSSLQDEAVLQDNPQFEAVCVALETGIYRPVIADWTQFYTILGDEISNIIDDNKTLDKGLKDAQSELEALMNN